jgi:hypothetical protein
VCTLLSSGGVMCWGLNDQSQIGFARTDNGSVFIQPTVIGFGSGPKKYSFLSFPS